MYTLNSFFYINDGIFRSIHMSTLRYFFNMAEAADLGVGYFSFFNNHKCGNLGPNFKKII